jgi:hypothetical protein
VGGGREGVPLLPLLEAVHTLCTNPRGYKISATSILEKTRKNYFTVNFSRYLTYLKLPVLQIINGRISYTVL